MCLQCILIRYTPSLLLPHPPFPILEQFQQVSLFYFHTPTQSTSTILVLLPPSTLSVYSPSSHLYSLTNRTYFTILSFVLLCAYCLFLSFIFLTIVFTCTYMCIHYLSHLHCCLPPTTNRQNLFYPLVL
jgi:hypothetical protein